MKNRLEAAVDRIANALPEGHLLVATTDAAGILDAAAAEIERLAGVLAGCENRITAARCDCDEWDAHAARSMASALRANSHKPGWHDDTPGDLLDRVHDEVLELGQAVRALRRDPAPANRAKVLSEAADLANMAMMVADACEAAGKRETQEARTDEEPWVWSDDDTAESVESLGDRMVVRITGGHLRALLRRERSYMRCVCGWGPNIHVFLDRLRTRAETAERRGDLPVDACEVCGERCGSQTEHTDSNGGEPWAVCSGCMEPDQ